MNKREILNFIQNILTEKIQNLQKLIEETRASSNDTKSSMGDKYETGREMLQQEINNLQIQLNGFSNSMNILKNINPVPHQSVGLGSLIQTEKGKFFIAISLGEIVFEKEKIFIISAESPLAKAMHGLKKNDIFSSQSIFFNISCNPLLEKRS
ncbi:MAG TPA: hypothetical protein PKI04_04785 [Kaistella sp.]|nr:hypothetical protein [Kaistella sp.]